MNYEAWRISYQSSEQAARAAYAECVKLRAKIEAAEKDIALKERIIDSLGVKLNAVANEREAELMARLEEEKKHYENTYKKLLKERKITSAMIHNVMQMGRELKEIDGQKPVGKFIQNPSNGIWEQDVRGDNPEARPLYLAAGAKGAEK